MKSPARKKVGDFLCAYFAGEPVLRGHPQCGAPGRPLGSLGEMGEGKNRNAKQLQQSVNLNPYMTIPRKGGVRGMAQRLTSLKIVEV